MQAVGRAAGRMVDEVRRQFRDIPRILEGRAEPDYARCVAISTQCAQREMVLPSCLAVVVPVAVGLVLVLGVAVVIGLLIGGLTTGFVLAVFLANSAGHATTPRNTSRKAITEARVPPGTRRR
jgi:K(+)-stimulated pyrophosphate-energized sodium pump